MPGLSRLTPTVIGAHAALAALIFTTNAWLRDDLRALRDDIRLLGGEFRTETRDVHTGARMDREAWRAEVRTGREAWRAEVRADRAAFESRILRLTE